MTLSPRFGVAALLLTVSSFDTVYAGPITLQTMSSMDITVQSIAFGGTPFTSLGALLGGAGQVAVFASSGRVIDPETSAFGSASASATLQLLIDGVATTPVYPDLFNFTTPVNAQTELTVGDTLQSSTSGTVTLLNSGDKGTSSSAPNFQIYIENFSSDYIFLAFEYTFSASGEIFGSDQHGNVGFNHTWQAAALKFNGTNFGSDESLGGGFLDHYGGGAYSFLNQGILLAELHPNSLNVIAFYNTHQATGEIVLPQQNVPEESSLLVIFLGIAAMAAFNRTKRPRSRVSGSAGSSNQAVH